MNNSSLHKILLVVQGIPFNAEFTLLISDGEIIDITIHKCSYEDHRAYWIDTGFRPSFVSSDNFQSELKKEIIDCLNCLEEGYNTESTFEDHLYEWGYSEADQLEYFD